MVKAISTTTLRIPPFFTHPFLSLSVDGSLVVGGVEGSFVVGGVAGSLVVGGVAGSLVVGGTGGRVGIAGKTSVESHIPGGETLHLDHRLFEKYGAI